jgi:hypothetical protein
MVVAMVVLAALFLGASLSIGLVIRDVRRLHASKRELADSPMDAAGASAAGMVFYGNTFSH